MEILSTINTLVQLRDCITSLKDVFNITENESKAVNSLKLSLLRGWQVLDRVLEYCESHKNGEITHITHVNEVKKTLIQLFYDVEDRLDINKPYWSFSSVVGSSRGNASNLQEDLDSTLDQWEKVLQGETNSINTRHSSMNLEDKRCLAYSLLFPDDCQLNTDDMVHLWIGECFVQPQDDTISLKQFGEIYLKQLREKFILQPLEDSELRYKFSISHQDFAKSFAAGTCLHLDQYRSSLDEKTRHLSLSCDFNSGNWSRLKIPKLKLRTLLSLYTKENRGHLKEILPKLKKSLSVLRVLSLRYTSVQELPAFTYQLKHLRYLDISSTQVQQLPSNLHKRYPVLKFLRIKDSGLLHLPTKEFQKLTNLRYVDWEEAFLREMEVPCHIGDVTHLEKLPLFQIGTKDGYFISELNGMNNLQGSICIENLEHVYAKPDDDDDDDDDRDMAEEAMRAAKEAMLHKKHGLRRIALHWKFYSLRDCACDEHVLRGLQPHDNVKELKIENYGGEDLPVWIRESKIEKVSLVECRYCYLPALGKMKNLKTLVVEDIRHIKEVRCCSDGDADTVGSFPSLESMEFHNMDELVEWTGLEEERDVLPSLKELKFVGCTKIDSSLPFIKFLMESRPSMYISNDSECMRCNGDGTCSSSVACSN